jgi:hypothetical protein
MGSHATQAPSGSSAATTAYRPARIMLLAPYGGGKDQACNITGDSETVLAGSPAPPPPATTSASPSVASRPRRYHAYASASGTAQREDPPPIPQSSRRRTAAPFSCGSLRRNALATRKPQRPATTSSTTRVPPPPPTLVHGCTPAVLVSAPTVYFSQAVVGVPGYNYISATGLVCRGDDGVGERRRRAQQGGRAPPFP